MMSHEKTHEHPQHQEVEGISKKSKLSAYRGLLMALTSGVLYSASAVIVKQIKNLHPGQLAVYRLLANILFTFPEAVKCKENFLGPKNFRTLLILRSILNESAVFLYFLAFRYLPLGESAVIIFSFPIFVTIAAKIFLKEHCGKIQFLIVLMTVVGIVLVVKIPQKLSGSYITYTTESIYGFLSAVGSLIFTTSAVIVMRKVKSVHHSIMMFSFGWFGILELVILTAIFGNFHWHNCGLQSLYIIVLCLLCHANLTLVIKSLQCEMAGPVSTMRAAAEIIFAFLWQIFLFCDTPDIYSSIGAVLVGASVIFVSLNKWVSSLSEDSVYRKKLIWIIK